MKQVDVVIAVQKMQEYIESHLDQQMTLKQLADASGYSPWHAMRLFKEVTGHTPFAYVRSLRLTSAALELRDKEVKVLDVALDFVFDSHEGFTRAFSKEFGLPPKRYSQKTPPIQLFMPVKVFDTYRSLQKGGSKMENQSFKTVFVQVVERPARKLLLKRGVQAKGYFAYCEEVGCEVWSLLTSVKEALYEPVGLWLPSHLIAKGTSQYVQGVELPLNYDNSVPEGYDLIELPPCTMMVFQGEPYNDDDFMAEIGAVWKHIDKFDPGLYGYKWDAEAAPRFQLVPMGYRGYIEARPVRKIE